MEVEAICFSLKIVMANPPVQGAIRYGSREVNEPFKSVARKRVGSMKLDFSLPIAIFYTTVPPNWPLPPGFL